MKVLVVGDDALIAQSSSATLSIEIDVRVVSLGRSGPEVIERCRELKPDIPLMDTQMLGGDRPSTAERILARDVVARIVFLIAFSSDRYVVRTLRMGSRGYLIKQDVAQIVPALQSVMAGVCVLEGEVLEYSTTTRLSTRPEPGDLQNKPLRGTIFAALTDRGHEVVGVVAEGLDDAEVAARLSMNEGTVRNHISSILAKLGLHNRTRVAAIHYRFVQAG